MPQLLSSKNHLLLVEMENLYFGIFKERLSFIEIVDRFSEDGDSLDVIVSRLDVLFPEINMSLYILRVIFQIAELNGGMKFKQLPRWQKNDYGKIRVNKKGSTKTLTRYDYPIRIQCFCDKCLSQFGDNANFVLNYGKEMVGTGSCVCKNCGRFGFCKSEYISPITKLPMSSFLIDSYIDGIKEEKTVLNKGRLVSEQFFGHFA